MDTPTDKPAERSSEKPMDPEVVRSVLQHGEEEARREAIAAISGSGGAPALELLVTAMGDESWRVRKEAVGRIVSWPALADAIPALLEALKTETNVALRNSAVEALARIGTPAVAPLAGRLAGRPEERKLLIDTLGMIGDRGAVPELVGCLSDSDENVRAAAAEALGGVGGEEATQALVRHLETGDALGRVAALEALVRLKARIPVAQLQPIARSAVFRRLALLALGHAQDLAALPTLLEALGDRARGTQETAVLSLARLGESYEPAVAAALRAAPAEVLERLSAPLRSDNVETRCAAAQLLGWSGAPFALPALVSALRDEDAREAAAAAISALGAVAVQPLLDLMKDLDPPERAATIEILPRLGGVASDPRTQSLLIAALRDDDPEVAIAAANGLAEVGGRDALAPLFHGLEAEETGLVTAAAQALSRLGARYHDEILLLIAARGIDVAQGTHGTLRGIQLCRIVAAMGRPEDRPFLLTGLRHEVPALRKASADGLARLGRSREVAQALAYGLADEAWEVRAAAARALGVVGDAEAVGPLLSVVADDEASVRAAAARSLGMLADARARPTLGKLAKDRSGDVATEALEALRGLAVRGANPGEWLRDEDLAVFREAVGSADAEVAKAALRALLSLADNAPAGAARQALTDALGHPAWDVRALAARSLARDAAEPEVRNALVRRRAEESDAVVRGALDEALGGAAGEAR